MTEGNEVPIGALRADATEKPEATVLRNFAKFAAATSPYLKNPKQPDVAVVTSQAAQFSVFGGLQLEAQQNAVRALGYNLNQPCYIIAESQIDKLGSPKLVVLPSAQALRASTWQALLAYVKSGGNLLVTGPVSRDEHWHLVDRLTSLGIKADTEPLTAHTMAFYFNAMAGPPISFDQQKQQLLAYLRFADGANAKELSLGNGKLFWVSYPLELAETPSAGVGVYNTILDKLGIHVAFQPFSTLIYPIEFPGAVLYILESETDRDADFTFHDPLSGAELSIHLPAQHAALALIDKHTKQIVAKYGF